MVTGVNGANSTQKVDAPKSEVNSEKAQDSQALKTLLTLVFTLAAANNHNNTIATAGRYGSAAGQALLLMNNFQQNPSAGNDLTEKLVDGLVDIIHTNNDERQKPQEPISLVERNAELKELKQTRKAKKKGLKNEIHAVKDDLGLNVSKASTAKKQAKEKLRLKKFQKALSALAQRKSDVKSKILRAQIDGNERSEIEAKRELTQVKIEERVFATVSSEDKSKKGQLEEVTSIAQEIKEQISTIEEAKLPAEQKRFFGLMSKPDTRTNESRQRAISGAQETITELLDSVNLAQDTDLVQMIKSHID